ncbi:MAG TPA: hypothetical protein VGK54_02370, partial [Chloroflexota bacterium]
GRYINPIRLSEGWNAVRLPWNDPGWKRETKVPNEDVPQSVDVASISPMSGMTFMLGGHDRKDRGAICFDNIRIE